MPFHHNVAATWKSLVLWHNVAGTWKKIALHHNVAGTWKALTTLFGATLNAASWTHFTVTPANAASGIKVDSDGSIYRLSGSTYTAQYTWLTGGGVNTDYECRWTNVTGTLSSGTAGTWASCGSDQGFNRNNNSDTPSTQTVTGTLEIRMAAAPNTVLATASITLTADVTA